MPNISCKNNHNSNTHGGIAITMGAAISFMIMAIILFTVNSNEPDIYKIKCNELNCTVNIINGECFAKLSQMIGYDFQPVKCDKPRPDENYIVLPCNVEKEGKIKINCDKKNTTKSDGQFFATCLLVGSLIIGFLSWIWFIMGCIVTCDDAAIASPDVTSVSFSQNLDNQTDTSHEKSTGSKYTQFDKEFA